MSLKDSWLPIIDDTGFKVKPHQESPIEQFVDCIATQNSTGRLLTGGTGVGKTVIAALAIKICQEKGYLPKTSSKLASVLYLGPNSIQSRRVFARAKVRNVHFMSYSSLRSTSGESLINWRGHSNEKGEIDYIPEWDTDEIPDLIIGDEVQKLKNPDALQSKCVLEAIDDGSKFIGMSATPFQKAIEAETIFRACHLCGATDALATLRAVAAGDIRENSPAQIKRIKEYLESRNRLIAVKNARFPFPVKFWTTVVNFQTPAEEKFYSMAYEIYLEERREKGKLGTPQGNHAKWVAMQKFWEAAETLKSFRLAQLAVERFKEYGGQKQIIISCNFVQPLRNVWRQLRNMGVAKDRIAIIIGGQSEEERQAQVDYYQANKADFLLMTVASGGTSLDLPNDSDRNRPRHVIVPICWSVYNFLQLIGRVHRMSSRSISTEEIVIFGNTIEEHQIKPRLDIKIKCVSELQDRKDSFIIDIFNKGVDEQMKAELDKEIDKADDHDDEDGEASCFDASMLEIVKSE